MKNITDSNYTKSKKKEVVEVEEISDETLKRTLELKDGIQSAIPELIERVKEMYEIAPHKNLYDLKVVLGMANSSAEKL